MGLGYHKHKCRTCQFEFKSMWCSVQGMQQWFDGICPQCKGKDVENVGAWSPVENMGIKPEDLQGGIGTATEAKERG